MQNIPALITLIVYSAALVGIGVWMARRTRSQDQFLLGERSLGPWMAGLAYAASSSSAWVLLGFSGFVYVAGLSALWMVPGIMVGYAVVWLWAGGVLQDSSREKGHLTLTDFMTEGASANTAKGIRVAASLMIAFCYAWYIAAQFQGAGQAFDDLFETGLMPGVLIGAAIILCYTFLGGFLAVALIDMLQGLLIAVVAIVLPVVAFFAAGGIDGIVAGLNAAPAGYADPMGGRIGWVAAGFALGLLAPGFGAMGQPHLVSWIMAARDRSARLRGASVALTWCGVVYLGMAVLGLSARAIFGTEAPAEGVFFKLAAGLLPAVLAGVIAAATLSAIMSTVDSQLLVAGAAVSHDMGLARAVGVRDVLISRLAILVICFAAVVITLFLPSTIFERALFAWTALGGAFGPVVVARAFSFRPSGEAVLLAITSGFATAIVFEFIWYSGPGDIWARLLPWISGCAALFVTAQFQRQLRANAAAAQTESSN